MKFWKLQRELDRVRSQILGWLTEPFEPFARYRHDEWLAKAQPIKLTHLVGRRVAVFLVYQPMGLSESTIESCRVLSQSGFSVLLVSNTPISRGDQARLSPYIWCIFERPNFGYDFGGYRDAIHWLWRERIQFEQLLLLNDSIWFPVQSSQSNAWLDDLCDHPSEFCGAMELAGHRQERRRRRQKPAFLGSFFLLFKQRALESEAFRTFWNGYRMTSNKRKTIRRGERAITAAMVRAEFPPHALLRREMFDEYVFSLSAPALRDALESVIAYDDSNQKAQTLLLQTYTDSVNWAEEARRAILDITNLQNLFVTAPVLCLAAFDFPILKKAQTYQNLRALQSIDHAYRNGHLSLHPVIAQEIKSILIRTESK